MPWNGAGVWSPVYNWTVEANNGVKILAAHQDTQWQDLATSIMNCWTLDGQTRPTANFNMATFKLTNMGAGVAATDSATIGDIIPSLQATSIYLAGGVALASGASYLLGTVGSPWATTTVKGVTANWAAGRYTFQAAGDYHMEGYLGYYRGGATITGDADGNGMSVTGTVSQIGMQVAHTLPSTGNYFYLPLSVTFTSTAGGSVIMQFTVPTFTGGPVQSSQSMLTFSRIK